MQSLLIYIIFKKMSSYLKSNMEMYGSVKSESALLLLDDWTEPFCSLKEHFKSDSPTIGSWP